MSDQPSPVEAPKSYWQGTDPLRPNAAERSEAAVAAAEVGLNNPPAPPGPATTVPPARSKAMAEKAAAKKAAPKKAAQPKAARSKKAAASKSAPAGKKE